MRTSAVIRMLVTYVAIGLLAAFVLYVVTGSRHGVGWPIAAGVFGGLLGTASQVRGQRRKSEPGGKA